MLVLTRKLDQKILIGENIVITVVRIEGDRVRIGVTAPPEIPVLRDDARKPQGPPPARGK